MLLLPFVLAAWGQDLSCPDPSASTDLARAGAMPKIAPDDGLSLPRFPTRPSVLGPSLATSRRPGWDARAVDAKEPAKPAQDGERWTEARAANLERGLGFGAAAGLLWVTGLLAGAAYDERPAGGLFVATDAALIGAAASGGVGVVFTGAALFGK